MHPIEHLRYVARARGADPVSLVRETAAALSGLGHEPAGIVLATRRIVQRHPTCAPLWWLCSHVLGALDPFSTLRDCEEEIKNDTTIKNLRDAVPQDAVVCVVGWPTAVLHALASRGDAKIFVVESNGDGDAAVERLATMNVDATLVQFEELSRVVGGCDVVIVEALAAGPTEVLCSAGSHGVAALAYCLQKPVWLVTACGTRLPTALWTAMVAGVNASSTASDVDVFSASLFSRVISKQGVSDDLSQPFVAECPPTTELLRHSAM
ncbi:MAG: hypothetical protein O2841_00910 [Actinomycetota bacterium]|nr:hypothetical protein [Actinomycetota bacterium]